MTGLITSPNLSDPDDIYEQLLNMHDGLSEAESLRVWSKLSLLLINHIGDREVVEQAIVVAGSNR